MMVLQITVDQLTVLLAPEGTYVNGRMVKVPTPVDKLLISKISNWIIVKGLEGALLCPRTQNNACK